MLIESLNKDEVFKNNLSSDIQKGCTGAERGDYVDIGENLNIIL